MEIIIINNAINILENGTTFQVTAIVPRFNIQKMLEETKGHFVSKKTIELPYNHHAGEVFELEIIASLENVKKYLTSTDFREASNFNDFKKFIEINKIGNFWYSYALQNVLVNKITGLYKFGESPNTSYSTNNQNVHYFTKEGKRLSFYKAEWNDFGKKRYLRTNQGKLLTNRKF